MNARFGLASGARVPLCFLMISCLPSWAGQKPELGGSEYTFRSEVDLLSVAVRVTDRNNNEIHGLTAKQFSLYQDGIPQKISFFDAEKEPVSLGILLDVSGSMAEAGKLEQAKDALSRVISDMRPEDEMFYLRFNLKVDMIVDLTSDLRRILSAVSDTRVTEDGTSLYDAIAAALCYMRGTHHHRQALLVVTDGADQNSHRSLEDLVPTVQASQAQVFIIGFLSKREYDLYRSTRHQKIPLVTRQEIDNPITAFDQLAKESGAESFFVASPEAFREAVEAVTRQLRTEYTLAYYPKTAVSGFHRIDVNMTQSGVRVRARRGFASPAAQLPAEQPMGCADEKLKPYPYEIKVAVRNGCTIYQEDFGNTASGWPNKEAYHYKTGSYEIVNLKPSERDYMPNPANNPYAAPICSNEVRGDSSAEGVLVANGPVFGDFNTSVGVSWKSVGGAEDVPAVPGLVFHLNHRGYYAILVSKKASQSHVVAFKLVKRYHSELTARDLVPWTEIPLVDWFAARQELKISVQCRGPEISIILQGTPVAKFEDADFKDGLVGMMLCGRGRADFRDLLAEEVCDKGRLSQAHRAKFALMCECASRVSSAGGGSVQ